MCQAAGEGRRDRRKRENHARIYDAARRLFLVQGVDSTTVEQIAATADIAPATFFNHFPSKRAVLNEMTSEVFAFLGFAIEQQLKATGATRERLARLASPGEGAERPAPAMRAVRGHRDLLAWAASEDWPTDEEGRR